MAGRLRPLADREPLPVDPDRPHAGLARARATASTRRATRAATPTSAPVLRRDHASPRLALGVPPRAGSPRRPLRPSPYYLDLARARDRTRRHRRLPTIEQPAAEDDDPIAITYSELAVFLDCGHGVPAARADRLPATLAPELGYGKAVHHVMRTVAEATQATGRVPTRRDRRILDDELLPAVGEQAGAPTAEGRRAPARHRHTPTNHADDLHRIWETERPFELHLDGVTITGRADVILDKEGGVPTALAIVDYKTSTVRERRSTTRSSSRSTPTPAGGRGSTCAAPMSTT